MACTRLGAPTCRRPPFCCRLPRLPHPAQVSTDCVSCFLPFFPSLQEPGDLDYAAVALLALICSLLECLVGKDGLLNDAIPDFALLAALQARRGWGWGLGARLAWPGVWLGSARGGGTCVCRMALPESRSASQPQAGAWPMWLAALPNRTCVLLHRPPQAIIIFMHGMLLPCWCIVVLRWGRVL